MNIFIWIMIILGGGVGILSCAYLVLAMPVLLVWKICRKVKYHIGLFDQKIKKRGFWNLAAGQKTESSLLYRKLLSCKVKNAPRGCALRRIRQMSQATAAGARMCQGTFFFTRVSRSYASCEKKSGRYGKCFSMIGEKGGMVPRSMDA